MSAPPPHTDRDIAEALRLDLWNEHRYQIAATVDFRVVLERNVNADGTKVGDEASLSSALIHTRSLLEFYNPRIKDRRKDAIWWSTAVGYVDFVRTNSKLGKEVTDAVQAVQQWTHELWTERRRWAAEEHRIKI